MKIPVLIHYYTNNSKRVYFGVFAGPQITMINGVTLRINDKDMQLKTTDITPKDVYKSTTLDGVLGFGLGVNITSFLGVNANIRLDYSLGDVEKKDATATIGSAKYKYYASTREVTHTATAGLMIGVYYKFGKKILPGIVKKK